MDYNTKRSMILNAYKWHEKKKQLDFNKLLYNFYIFMIYIVLFYQIIFLYCSYYNINTNRSDKEVFTDILSGRSYIIPNDLD